MKSLFVILVNLSFASFVFGETKNISYFDKNSFKQFSVVKYDIHTKIDPRIEFLQTLMLLAGNPQTNHENIEYKLSILDKFNDFKNHSSLTLFRETVRKRFNSLDGPTFFFVRLNEKFELRKDIDNQIYEGDIEIKQFLNAVRNLAVEMDYISFVNQQINFYQTVLSVFEYNLTNFDEKNRMLQYFKQSKHSEFHFQIVLNLLGQGNFGPGLKTVKNQELYAIISPSTSSSQLPVFDLNEVHYLVWHEFSHSFINPLIDLLYQNFQTCEYLFTPIKNAMVAQGYSDWRVTLKEHFVRAVTCRLATQKYGETIAEWNYTSTEIGKKYIYLPLIIDELIVYEKNIDQSLSETVSMVADKLHKYDANHCTNLLEQVEEIRKPDVEELPKIGEVQKDILLIIPKDIGSQIKHTTPWPGMEMSLFKDGWYYYSIENTTKANVIFNNNDGLQTEDLINVTDNKFYDWNIKDWVIPAETFDYNHLEKQNSLLFFFKPSLNWTTKPHIYVWQDDLDNNFGTFIQRYQNYYQNSRIVTDQEALSMDLTGHDLVVFGSYENNDFLKKYYSHLPVKITNDGIVADRYYKADDLVFITAWLHPTDSTRKSELYISSTLQNLVNLDWVQRGKTNYHITRGLITIKSGNYTRRMKVWRL